MKIETLKFVHVDEGLPELKGQGRPSMFHSRQVLVRGYGEKRRYYVYVLAHYESCTASKRWTGEDPSTTLWFEPVEWAELPQPDPVPSWHKDYRRHDLQHANIEEER